MARAASTYRGARRNKARSKKWSVLKEIRWNLGGSRRDWDWLRQKGLAGRYLVNRGRGDDPIWMAVLNGAA